MKTDAVWRTSTTVPFVHARGWNPTRVGAALVLASWATVFWTLMVTGRVSTYLSPRTAWVVPMGGVLMSIATVGALLSARSTLREPLSRRGAMVMVLMVLPALAIAMLPEATLGSFSASRKGGSSSTAAWSMWGPLSEDGPITFLTIAAARTSKEGAKLLQERAGERVSLTGFVDAGDTANFDELWLTRFAYTCCAADALPVTVRVVEAPVEQFSPDDWVSVTGRIYPLGSEIVVIAESIVGTAQPEDPYLSP